MFKSSRRRKRSLLLENRSRPSTGFRRLRNTFFGLFSRLFLVRHIAKLFHKSMILTGFIIVMLGFIVFSVYSPHFHLKKITVVRDNPNLDIDRIEYTLGDFYGQNMLFIQKKDLVAPLKEEFPEFREVVVRERWPDEIELRIGLSPPLLNLLNTETANFSVISEDGVILEQQSDETLPVVKVFQYEKPIQVRERFLNKTVLDKIVLAEQLLWQEVRMDITDRRFYWAANEIHFINQRGTAVWVDLHEDIEEQVGKLVLAAEKIHFYSQPLEHVDLRIPQQIFWK